LQNFVSKSKIVLKNLSVRSKSTEEDFEAPGSPITSPLMRLVRHWHPESEEKLEAVKITDEDVERAKGLLFSRLLQVENLNY